jgi:Co/Zn/Cd efflux system component
MVFSILVVYTTIPLLDRVMKIFMEGVPAHVDWQAVKVGLSSIEGVEAVEHLHIWSLSSTSVSLTCHIKARNPQVYHSCSNYHILISHQPLAMHCLLQTTLKAALKLCGELKIDHPTFQVMDPSSYSEMKSLAMCV